MQLKIIGLLILFTACQKTDDSLITESDSLVSTASIDPPFVPVLGSPIKKDVKYNHEGNVHPANAGGQYTPLTTAPDGTIYTAWMDADRSLRLLQIRPDGTKTERVLRTNMQTDKYHVRPSVAVDKAGYIHVAADMHNQPWVYYRSLQPNSIDGFEALTPPGLLVSYPQFFKDNRGELFVCFRHKVKQAPNQWTRGSSAGGILRYDATAKTFTMLGGESHGFLKTLVWVDMGGVDTHYQQPGIRLFFDASNRMHLVCTLINEETDKSSEGNTHVLYAYSDDSGLTFRRVNGSAITTLPMTPATMTTVAYRAENDISANAFIGAFSSSRPVIGWRDSRGSFLVKWTGGDWMNILPEASAPSEFWMRRTGELAIFRPYMGFYQTTDQAQTYQKFLLNPALPQPANQAVDAEYYLQSGNLRFQFTDKDETKIWTATLTLKP